MCQSAVRADTRINPSKNLKAMGRNRALQSITWRATLKSILLALICAALGGTGCGGPGGSGNPETVRSIQVTAGNSSIAKGTMEPFSATATYADGTVKDITSSVTWSSENTAVATITSGGVVTGVATGSAIIQAVFSGVTGKMTLTVTAATLASISVTAANPSIAKGLTEQFTATGTFSDGTTQNLTATAT